jgi:hypothetical protein
MSRAVKALSLLCAASLLGNLWLYRELNVRERAGPQRLASLPPQAQSVVPNVNVLAAPQAAIPSADLSKPTSKQTLDKCRKKYEDDMLRQLRDPKERENLKQHEIMSLQATNVGAATRLHLSEQTLSRMLELQADQDLSLREASIGSPRSPKVVTVNPQIAEEFGEAIATKWADYLRESSGRTAVQGVANLFADANVTLSEEQRRRLVGVYADEFELQNAQDPGPDTREMQGDRGNPRAMANWFEKQAARQQAFEQRVQADAASFLTPVQLELLRKRSDLESERFRSLIKAMPKAEGNFPIPEFEC